MEFLKKIIFVLAICLAFTSFSHAKNCRKGIPCGNSCISANKTCRIGSYAPAPVSTETKPTISKQNFNNAKTHLVKIYGGLTLTVLVERFSKL